MQLIIDCYNLLHAPMPEALAGLDEHRLCRLLASGFSHDHSNGKIAVVCDGVVKPLGISRSPVESVKLLYSGVHRTADEVIIEMIEADTAPRRLTVVSTDRQIRKAARRRRAKALTSDQFVIEMLRRMSASALASRTKSNTKGGQGPLSPSQVRYWLDTFGVDGEQTPEFDQWQP